MIQKHEKASNPKTYSSSLRTARNASVGTCTVPTAAHLLFARKGRALSAAPPPSSNARRSRGGSPALAGGQKSLVQLEDGKERFCRHLHGAEVAHLLFARKGRALSAAPPPSFNARRCRGGSPA
ncbi:MAG: hypothetical protein SPL18_02035, partial [Oscillospiraceae bacterium]|nr:hypothetical protein [Oscillospiraceae bacterium]